VIDGEEGDTIMKSKDLGLPFQYQQFPEYFDTPSDVYHTDEKNRAIEQLLKKYSVKSVLDLACGTGAQVLHLATLGYDVTGADFSPGLVEIAKDKVKKLNINAALIDGDMRELQAGVFDAVITIDNAIGHLIESDFVVALNNISNNLKQGGIYIFDILNLDAMTDDVVEADNNRMTDERTMADGAIICNQRHSTIDRDNGYFISDNNITIQKDGKENKIKNQCTLKIYTMNELQKLLVQNGFEVMEQFKVDAYTFKKDDSGYSILTVARKY